MSSRSLLAFGLMLLGATSDAEPRQPTLPCRVAGVAVRGFSGSRLFEAPGDRLELLAGRPLDCSDPEMRRVLTSVEAVFQGPTALPRARFGRPLHVHLAPRLPPRQAPLAGIEVHVSSRELLVARSALGQLGPEVWQHELLHTIAAPLPEAADEARRLWLTLEEGLVAHVAAACIDRRGEALPDDPARARASGPAPGGAPRSAAPSRHALPLGALLASPAYDPHPLAAGLAHELGRQPPAVAIENWFDCLSAPQPAWLGDAPASEVFRAFVARCSRDAARDLESAISRWWVDAAPPAARVANSRRKPAARTAESR